MKMQRRNLMIKSKHLGKRFGRWTVSRVSRERDGHYRFYLTRKTSDGAIKTVGLTNVTMAKLARGETTVATLLKNKQFQRNAFPSREYRNSVWYTYETNGSLE